MRISLTVGMRRVLLVLVLVAAGVVGIGTIQPATAQDNGAQTPTQLCEAALPNVTDAATQTYDAAPAQILEEGVDYRAIFCTEQGAIYVDLYEQFTPITVNNFVFLSNAGYYNNTTFHRVIADFMVQGGDPLGNGTGGPGYEFEDEFLPFLSFYRPGLLAMANAGPATNGSQFFITRVPTPHLDGAHTIFGEVLQGQDVVMNITDRDPQLDSEAGDTLNTVLIITDPATVQTPAAYTGEQTLETISTIFAEDPTFTQLEQGTGVFNGVEASVAQYEETAQAVATNWYGLEGFTFEAGSVWQVTECPADPNLFGVGLRVLDWGTLENAYTAVQDVALTELMSAQGFAPFESSEELGGPVFSRSTSAYCDKAGIQARYIVAEGHYVLMIDVVLDEKVDGLEQLPSFLKYNLGAFFEQEFWTKILEAMNE